MTTHRTSQQQTIQASPRGSLVKKIVYGLCISAAGLLLFGEPLNAQDDLDSPPDDSINMTPDASPSDASPNSGAQDDDDTIIRPPPKAPPATVKIFTAAETQKVCAKYQGKLLSVYGEVFKVKNCTRHLLQEQDDIFKMSRQGIPTVDVEATDVAAIPVGEPWSVINLVQRPCTFFNKKYVTFSYTDLYYVDGCARKLLPDYETYLAHSQAHGDKNRTVLALTAEEFFKMRQGDNITSVLDKEYSRLYELSANVDIIPIDEACKGAEGKIVMFYSRMYKIEKCHKREIDAEHYTMHSSVGNSKIKELTPEQWVSMPDGKPYPDPKATKK